MTKVIKEAHYRSLQSLAIVMEEKLQAMEALLCLSNMPMDDGRLLKINGDFTVEEKSQFLEKLALIRENMLAFVGAYELKETERSLKKALGVKAAFLWEEISGATFDRLKGYGEIDEGLRQEYENHIIPLTNLSIDLMRMNSDQDDN